MSVFGSGGKYVLVLHTYVLKVQYSCGVALVFWFWREIVFGVTYVLGMVQAWVGQKRLKRDILRLLFDVRS